MNERIIVNGVNREMTDEEQALALANRPNPRIGEIKLELQDILQWFSENDWKANKRVREEWTASDTRWLDYVLECEIMRNRQDELNNELATIV